MDISEAPVELSTEAPVELSTEPSIEAPVEMSVDISDEIAESCCVCMDEAPSVVIVPCGNKVLCAG